MSKSLYPENPSGKPSPKPVVVQWLTDHLRHTIQSQSMASESSLFQLLKVRYPENAYALFPQVRNSTGFAGSRTADAIAIGLWPSRGMEVEGFEMKVSRTDWQKELKSPEKAEVICKVCDRWWVVISDEKIIQEGELPATWGLLVQKGGKLVVKKQAPKLEAQPMDRGFIASLFRKLQEQSVAKSEIQGRIDEAYRAGKEEEKRIQEVQTRRSGDHREKQELEDLKKALAEFEAESGIEINRWGGKKMGEAVRFYLNNDSEKIEANLKYLRNQLSNVVTMLEKGIQTVRQTFGKDEGVSGGVPE
jgi:hypothetical protein